MNDPYVMLAKKQGFRSRSAYKLIEIDDKFKILRPGNSILDLGSCPGGWAQVAAQRVGTAEGSSMVVAVDIKPIDKIPYVTSIQCDIENSEYLSEALEGRKFDVVLSDMAPKSCGHKHVDHANIINLCEMALEVALKFLSPKGSFVTKVLQGTYQEEFCKNLKNHFGTVAHFKPKSSRKDSSEIYLVGLRLKNMQSTG